MNDANDSAQSPRRHGYTIKERALKVASRLKQEKRRENDAGG